MRVSFELQHIQKGKGSVTVMRPSEVCGPDSSTARSRMHRKDHWHLFRDVPQRTQDGMQSVRNVGVFRPVHGRHWRARAFQ